MMAKQASTFIPWVALLLLSCGTDDDATVVGSDFILDREWADPVDTTFAAVAGDTWFEAIARGGQQYELLVGERRKFVFSAAVRWDDFPAEPDSITSAALLIGSTEAEGTSELSIERITEDWTESKSVDTLDTSGDGFTIPLPADEIVPIDVEWVRGWADPDGNSRGVYLTLVDPDRGFLRIPAREEPDSTIDPVRLRVVYRDSAGVDSVDLDPVADRFDGVKLEGTDYSLDNEPADTLLVGMRESLTNQAMFRLGVPEVLRLSTVNRAELELPIAAARLDEDESLTFELHVILDATDDTTDCPGTILCDRVVFESLISATGYVSGDDPGESLLIDVTSLVRRWVTDGEYSPRVLLRAAENVSKRRYLVLHSVEAAGDSPRPRLNVIYTPPRPGGDAGGKS